MLEKLPQLEKDLKAFEKSLQDPEIFRDAQKMATTSQKYNILKETVEQMRSLQTTRKQLTDTKELLAKEADPDMRNLIEHEIKKLQQNDKQLTQSIQQLLLPKDPLDQKNVIMEIRAGTGGDEAALFAAQLFRMYTRYADQHGWKHDILSTHRTGLGGLKEIIFEIAGRNIYQYLKYESGVHRVQRVPETEKSGRVHTSAATVAVLPEAEEIDLKIKPEDLRIDVFRSSGHGGQSVNTTDSAVRITHLPTNTVVNCQDEKSQIKNREKALKVLRSRLLAQKEEEAHKKRSDTRKSQIGTGDRSEKIRTYNFPQDRLTDHRIKKSWHEISLILDGHLELVISTLQQADLEKRL